MGGLLFRIVLWLMGLKALIVTGILILVIGILMLVFPDLMARIFGIGLIVIVVIGVLEALRRR
jgi:hypothetical protein